ncbi:MAG: metallophosphoesterase, partial [Woeseiaceae bacterium]|nr:metallophosphoesterase [Woeseiaceae bacterium]
MRRRLLVITCTLLLIAAGQPAVAQDWTYDDVGRVVAIGDVHGAFDAMVRTLQNASVINEANRWIAGDTHLVIVGDLLDRGPDSRAVMDLLMALEREAGTAGGRVHVLIGNHEVMNLVGDLRYVSAEEYAAFAGEETAAERQRGFDAWRQRKPADSETAALEAEFSEKAPPGFYAHRRAFAANGRYGRWLLSKPLIVVINGTAFVHGGLSPLVAELGLDGVNNRLMNDVRSYVDQMAILERAGVLLPTDNFYDHVRLIEQYLPSATTSNEVLTAMSTLRELAASDVHALDGPLWYRGNVACSALIERDRLQSALAAIGASRVVIGHTPTPSRRVLQRFGGQVLEIDTGMLNDYYRGRGHALILLGDVVGVVSEDQSEIQALQPHPRQVGMRPGVYMSAETIEQLLATGDISNIREDELRRKIVTISANGRQIEAVFDKRPSRGFFPEVAAYKLDRLLGLDAVPVAVRREVDGDDGSLQFVPERWIDEPARSQSGQGGSASCPLDEQWAAMYVFDALIYNEGRTLSRMIYSPDEWRLMLIGHQNAFSTKSG